MTVGMDTRLQEKLPIALRFRALRMKAHLTQNDLGHQIGIGRQAVNEIENCHAVPHRSTWGRFRELECNYEQGVRIHLPEHWL